MTIPIDDESAEDSAVEKLLLGLTLRATPADVRERVLCRLKSEAREETTASNIRWSRANWSWANWSWANWAWANWAWATWSHAFDFSVAALVLITLTAWFSCITVHSERMKAILGPTALERRAQRDARSLDLLASDEAIRNLQIQLATHYKRAQRFRGVSQTVHSPTLDQLPDFWRNKNAETHHQDNHRPSGNRSSGHSHRDVEIKRTA